MTDAANGSRRRGRLRRLEDAVCPAAPRRRRPDHTTSEGRSVAAAASFDDGTPINLHCDPAHHRPVPASRPHDALHETATQSSHSAMSDFDDAVTAAAPETADGDNGLAATEPVQHVVPPRPAEPPEPASYVEPAPAAEPARPTGPAWSAPPAGPAAQGGLGGWDVAPHEDDEEASFAQDVRAILAHADSLGPPPGAVPLPTVPVQEAPVPVDPAATRGIGTAAGHGLFDQMAPSRYDQGAVALSVDFDRLNRALAREEAATSAPAPPPGPHPPRPGTESAPPDSGEAPARPFRVMTDAPLVAQVTGLSCHAAACAAVVAWRDNVTPDPADVAAASGYWERYAEGRTAVFPDVLDAFGLTASSGTPTATEVRDLLDRRGPLWLAAAPPGEHAVVLAGVSGDGTSGGTVVDVVDPWAEGMTTYASPNPGSRYTVPFTDLLRSIAGPDGAAVLAHL